MAETNPHLPPISGFTLTPINMDSDDEQFNRLAEIARQVQRDRRKRALRVQPFGQFSENGRKSSEVSCHTFPKV